MTIFGPAKITGALSLIILISGCNIPPNQNISNPIPKVIPSVENITIKENIITEEETIQEAQGENAGTTQAKTGNSIKNENLTENTQKNPFIKITSPKNESLLYETPITISGDIDPTCSKIVVNSKNPDVPNVGGVYTLQKYKSGDDTFSYNLNTEWENIGVGRNEYTFEAYCDGEIYPVTINLYYHEGEMAELGKPVIYLYPEKEISVVVTPKPEGGISITEPELTKGSWYVTAHPDGAITDNQTGENWPYLFWEGFSNLEIPSEGFLVQKGNLKNFFDEKLTILGLNNEEINDFEEYWLSVLSDQKTYFITFVPQDQLDQHAPIVVNPEPQTSIRVFFDYREINPVLEYQEQDLEAGPSRNGFTIVEWGGRLYR